MCVAGRLKESPVSVAPAGDDKFVIIEAVCHEFFENSNVWIFPAGERAIYPDDITICDRNTDFVSETGPMKLMTVPTSVERGRLIDTAIDFL